MRNRDHFTNFDNLEICQFSLTIFLHITGALLVNILVLVYLINTCLDYNPNFIRTSTKKLITLELYKIKIIFKICLRKNRSFISLFRI